MLDKRITDLTEVTNVLSGSYIPLVDVTDLTDALTGTNKKVTIGNLINQPGSVSTQTTNYTATPIDGTIFGNALTGNITVTLPTAVGNTGLKMNVKKIDSSVNSVTVATTSSQTIDGIATYKILNQYTSITVISDGANWQII